MGRPKGSKNKPKTTGTKFETKADMMPPIKIQATEEWKPAPDMGAVKAPPESEKVCAGCQHKGGKHYGPAKPWCNVQGCSCQEFK
jgi:hypothetical protein